LKEFVCIPIGKKMADKISKPYGRVIINLENCLLPTERLACTASSLDGLDPETEMDLRILGCELIQTAGILLRLPQVVVFLQYTIGSLQIGLDIVLLMFLSFIYRLQWQQAKFCFTDSIIANR
jgi:hypothetical protein